MGEEPGAVRARRELFFSVGDDSDRTYFTSFNEWHKNVKTFTFPPPPRFENLDNVEVVGGLRWVFDGMRNGKHKT